MDSEIPKWMLPEPAVCFPNRTEEASQNKTEEEEMEKCKRPRTTLDGEGGVEEFLVLLERIEEMKKQLKRKRTNFRGSNLSAEGGINGAVEEDEMLMAMAGMQQAQGSSDAVDIIAYYNKSSSTSPWKPSFQWEDFNKSNSLSAEADSSGAAATEKNKEKEGTGSIQIGNRLLRTRSFLDRDAPAECSHDRVDDVKKNEEDVGATFQELELQLFPI